MMNEEVLAHLLAERFRGREERYALQQADGAYSPREGSFTPVIAQGHISGNLTAGIYVLRSDNTCYLAALDFDGPQYPNQDAMRLAVICASRVLLHQGIPHLLERSGKKGFHLWVFFAAPLPASLAREFLFSLTSQVEEEVGFDCPVEYFPKQDQVTEKAPWGNLIKVPWGKHRVTGKRAMFTDADLNIYESLAVQQGALEACDPLSEAHVREFISEFPAKSKPGEFKKINLNGSLSAFGRGSVPCTKDMLLTTVHESGGGGTGPGRNRRVFDIAIRLYREGRFFEQAHQDLTGFNLHRAKPPLSDKELEATVRSVYDHGYSALRCEENKAFCKFEQCAIWRSQNDVSPKEVEQEIREGEPSNSIRDLVKIDTQPPIWRLMVDEAVVQMEKADLLKFNKFRDAVFQSHNKILYIPRVTPEEAAQQAWERILRPLIESCTVEEAPAEASESGRLKEVIVDWAITNAKRTATRQDLVETRYVVCLPDYPDAVLFRMENLRSYLERRNIGSYKQHELWNALRELEGKSEVIRVGKKTVRCVLVPLELPEVKDEEEN